MSALLGSSGKQHNNKSHFLPSLPSSPAHTDKTSNFRSCCGHTLSSPLQSPAHGTAAPWQVPWSTEHWARRPEQGNNSQPSQWLWLAPGRTNTWFFSSHSIALPGNSVGSEYTHLPLHNGLVPAWTVPNPREIFLMFLCQSRLLYLSE